MKKHVPALIVVATVIALFVGGMSVSPDPIMEFSPAKQPTEQPAANTPASGTHDYTQEYNTIHITFLNNVRPERMIGIIEGCGGIWDGTYTTPDSDLITVEVYIPASYDLDEVRLWLTQFSEVYTVTSVRAVATA